MDNGAGRVRDAAPMTDLGVFGPPLGGPPVPHNVETLRRVIAQQRGLVTRPPCLSAGMTDGAIDHRVRTRRWVAVRRGRLPRGPRSLGMVVGGHVRAPQRRLRGCVGVRYGGVRPRPGADGVHDCSSARRRDPDATGPAGRSRAPHQTRGRPRRRPALAVADPRRGDDPRPRRDRDGGRGDFAAGMRVPARRHDPTVRAFWRDVDGSPCELATEVGEVLQRRGRRDQPHACPRARRPARAGRARPAPRIRCGRSPGPGRSPRGWWCGPSSAGARPARPRAGRRCRRFRRR
jgi:hypothetical protein